MKAPLNCPLLGIAHPSSFFGRTRGGRHKRGLTVRNPLCTLLWFASSINYYIIFCVIDSNCCQGDSTTAGHYILIKSRYISMSDAPYMVLNLRWCSNYIKSFYPCLTNWINEPTTNSTDLLAIGYDGPLWSNTHSQISANQSSITTVL